MPRGISSGPCNFFSFFFFSTENKFNDRPTIGTRILLFNNLFTHSTPIHILVYFFFFVSKNPRTFNGMGVVVGRSLTEIRSVTWPRIPVEGSDTSSHRLSHSELVDNTSLLQLTTKSNRRDSKKQIPI